MENLDEKTLGVRAGYRRTTWYFYGGVLSLIVVAFIAPVISLTLSWLPQGELRPSWFQRSGAVTTLLSFLAGALAVVTSGTLHTPGTWGDNDKLAVLIEFKSKFKRAELSLVLLTVAGTVIWGYGDLLLKWLIFPA